MATKKTAKKKTAKKKPRRIGNVFKAASKDRSYVAAKKKLTMARKVAKKAARKASVAYRAAIRKAKSKKR